MGYSGGGSIGNGMEHRRITGMLVKRTRVMVVVRMRGGGGIGADDIKEGEGLVGMGILIWRLMKAWNITGGEIEHINKT